MTAKDKIWVIIPAAGVGRRMGTDIPKQYLELNNIPVIHHSINVFANHPAIAEIVVVLSKDDEYWSDLNISQQKPLHIVDGGKERCDSVLNGLKFLNDKAGQNDWVLVHDAARPCLRSDDLTLLLDTLINHETGGILAIPVRDTMKRSVSVGDAHFITATVDRENLWHALTPQMFRFGMLYDALNKALTENKMITDEASAIEAAGFQPVLVEGHADNLKITHPDDLSLAAFYLRELKDKT
ncbi:MAG: 2-C-methyl-D-erythritol 4-phosphate cytidylyltransferase [Gammaproteobacteria bacterium]|nr:2-C-methyl-D-erythritol 4-phosphate cytidylyltransferase [Gammaproteobacteria bacterium]